MTLERVGEVLTAFAVCDLSVWVGGGWGVDAPIGRQTRPHRDLDLLVTDVQADEATALLEGMDYVRETDWWPIRTEFVRPDGGCVDLHPLTFLDDGSAVQPGPGGTHYHYAAEAFTTGQIGGRKVGCLSLAQQFVFHSGYKPRRHDLHDLDLLRELAES